MTNLSPRGVAGIAAAGVALVGIAVAAGTAVTAGVGPGTSEQVVSVRLGYTCAFPSGAEQTTVQVSATFPTDGTVGHPIRPTGTAVTAAFPHAAVADLLKMHAATVNSTGRLSTGVTHNGVRSTDVWPRLGSVVAPVPATGTLVLTDSGPARPVTVTTSGNVTFSAAALSLLLIPHTSGGGATSPPTVRVGCTLNAGQDASLATVAVTGTPNPSPGTNPVSVPPQAGAPTASALPKPGSSCPFPIPSSGYSLNTSFPPPTPPAGSTYITPPPELGCAYVEGFSDVKKLHGAALVGPGLTNIDIVRFIENLHINPVYFQEDTAGRLAYKPCPTCKVERAFPPATSTFLAFGFEPVTATIQLTENGNLDIYGVGFGGTLTSNTVYSSLNLRISDVKVNGVPLSVGNNCHIVHPISAALVGLASSKPPYSLQQGGPLTGFIKVPKFKGCGVGENLDPIFDATISGPGNFVKLTQGPVCFLLGGGVCPPPIPTPLR